MPLVLAPSFDDHTREQVEAHLEQVRLRRIAGALEFQQSKLLKLEKDNNLTTNKLPGYSYEGFCTSEEVYRVHEQYSWLLDGYDGPGSKAYEKFHAAAAKAKATKHKAA